MHRSITRENVDKLHTGDIVWHIWEDEYYFTILEKIYNNSGEHIAYKVIDGNGDGVRYLYFHTLISSCFIV